MIGPPKCDDIVQAHDIKITQAYNNYAEREYNESSAVVLQLSTISIIWHYYGIKSKELKKLMLNRQFIILWRNFALNFDFTYGDHYIASVPYNSFSSTLPIKQEIHCLTQHICRNESYSLFDYVYMPLAKGMNFCAKRELVVAISWNRFRELAKEIHKIRDIEKAKNIKKEQTKARRRDMTFWQKCSDIVFSKSNQYQSVSGLDKVDHHLPKFPEFVERLIQLAYECNNPVKCEQTVN